MYQLIPYFIHTLVYNFALNIYTFRHRTVYICPLSSIFYGNPVRTLQEFLKYQDVMEKMRKLQPISTKVTEPLARIIQEYIERDSHITVADFVRDAIKEKIRRDTPDLFSKLYIARDSKNERRDK